MESMRNAECSQWNMSNEQFSELAYSLRVFFSKTGISQSLSTSGLQVDTLRQAADDGMYTL